MTFVWLVKVRIYLLFLPSFYDKMDNINAMEKNSLANNEAETTDELFIVLTPNRVP